MHTAKNAADKARKFIYCSAGIWPNVEDIHKRKEKAINRLCGL